MSDPTPPRPGLLARLHRFILGGAYLAWVVVVALWQGATDWLLHRRRDGEDDG